MKFIADIGSNFRTLEQAKESIYQAKKAGADVVKFQLFSEYDLYGNGSTDRKIDGWLPTLAAKCLDLGVEFGCTAFSPEGLAIVDPFVKCHKIASSCVAHLPLLKAAGDTGKPLIISVGACTVNEVYDVMAAVPYSTKLTLMYCQAAYPSRWCDVRKIRALRALAPSSVDVGYSDHTIDVINAPVAAAMMGATVIEKHFTAFPSLQTPDRGHSLNPDEFKAMVIAVSSNEVFGPSPEEQEFREYHRTRCIEGKGFVRVRKP